MHSSTNRFKESISIAKRGCRFLNETIDGEQSIFNYYTQKGCQFECSMKFVTNCTPWDFPLPTNIDTANMPPLCTTYAASQEWDSNEWILAHFMCYETFSITTQITLQWFDHKMNEATGTEECTKKCVPNCQEVTYQSTMDTRYLNKNEFCETDHLFR